MVAKAYTPLISGIPKYVVAAITDKTVIETDKEYFLISTRFAYSDGLIHNTVLYTVPVGQTLFIQMVSVTGACNDTPASGIGGMIHVTALGLYIGGVELAPSNNSSTVNIYPTPIKLLEGDSISIVSYQPTALKVITGIVIVNGYLLSNF